MKKLICLLVLLAAVSLQYNFHQANAQVVVKVRPARPAVVMAKPATVNKGHIWVDGHWHWDSKANRYVWKKGHWVRTKKGHNWVAGKWVTCDGGHKWVPGYWKAAKVVTATKVRRHRHRHHRH